MLHSHDATQKAFSWISVVAERRGRWTNSVNQARRENTKMTVLVPLHQKTHSKTGVAFVVRRLKWRSQGAGRCVPAPNDQTIILSFSIFHHHSVLVRVLGTVLNSLSTSPRLLCTVCNNPHVNNHYSTVPVNHFASSSTVGEKCT